MKINKRKLAVPLLIGLGVFGLFTHAIGLEELRALLSSVDLALVLLAILFDIGTIILFTLSWRVLIAEKPGLPRLFQIYLVGILVNNITPSLGAGGEPVKALLLGNATETSSSACFATIITQRVLNMIPFILVALIGLLFLFFYKNLSFWEVLAMLFILGIIITALLLFIYLYLRKEKLEELTHNIIKRVTPLIRIFKREFSYEEYIHTIDNSIEIFHNELKRLSKKNGRLALALICSLIGWILNVATAYAVFLALNYNINPGILMITYTIAMIIGMIPLFLPGGVGQVDSIMALLYISTGVPKEIALLSTLLYRLISYWFNTLLGILAALTEHITINR
ncbi:Lysylphosphatidylglycerol synthase TM region [Candidatus Methanoperedenaceae archaeon GB37]|nr:Lysylphosphatidylglycerol synthase TM region [Candidatus Methanoperedenaceae archaeon GB37]